MIAGRRGCFWMGFERWPRPRGYLVRKSNFLASYPSALLLFIIVQLLDVRHEAVFIA